MSSDVYILGVGMTPFSKTSAGTRYEEFAPEAIRAALLDAQLEYNDIDQVFASYCMGDTCAGQRVVYSAGLSGVPIVNVNNACASGSTAIYLARQAVLSGQAERVLVVGFEQMPSKMVLGFSDRASPLEHWDQAVLDWGGQDHDVSTVGWFAAAAKEYIGRYEVSPLVFADIAAKARKHGEANPNAVFREMLSAEEISQSRVICAPLTKFECSAPTSGAAAVVVGSPASARRTRGQVPITLIAQALVTDTEASFSGSMMDLFGLGMSTTAANKVYESAGIGPEDVDVIELHDCFASNELITYEALGLASLGQGQDIVARGDNTHGGKWVVNPSGGLLSKGHPLGATGVAQCAELVWQLRGQADSRQTEGARIALQHNMGVGSACVVAMYRRDEL